LPSIFDADAEFVNVTGLWWHDRESIRQAHAYGLKHIFDRSILQLVRVKVKWLSDDIAVVHARMRLSGQTPIDGVPRHRPGRTSSRSLFTAGRRRGGVAPQLTIPTSSQTWKLTS
jgi:hypothetical protein